MRVKFEELCPALPKCSVPTAWRSECARVCSSQRRVLDMLNDLSEEEVPLVQAIALLALVCARVAVLFS